MPQNIAIISWLGVKNPSKIIASICALKAQSSLLHYITDWMQGIGFSRHFCQLKIAKKIMIVEW